MWSQDPQTQGLCFQSVLLPCLYGLHELTLKMIHKCSRRWLVWLLQFSSANIDWAFTLAYQYNWFYASIPSSLLIVLDKHCQGQEGYLRLYHLQKCEMYKVFFKPLVSIIVINFLFTWYLWFFSHLSPKPPQTHMPSGQPILWYKWLLQWHFLVYGIWIAMIIHWLDYIKHV